MTHTPAPWHYDEAHINVIDDAGRTVAARPSYSSCADSTEEADMRLIAAAPDLLAALEQCLPIVDAYRRLTMGDGDISAHTARTAIAKAKGA